MNTSAAQQTWEDAHEWGRQQREHAAEAQDAAAEALCEDYGQLLQLALMDDSAREALEFIVGYCTTGEQFSDTDPADPLKGLRKSMERVVTEATQ